MRSATVRAARRRGWVWPIVPRTPRPSSRQIFGSWVRLARPGLARHDHDLVLGDGGGDVVLALAHRQARRVRDAGHRRQAAGDPALAVGRSPARCSPRRSPARRPGSRSAPQALDALPQAPLVGEAHRVERGRAGRRRPATDRRGGASTWPCQDRDARPRRRRHCRGRRPSGAASDGGTMGRCCGRRSTRGSGPRPGTSPHRSASSTGASAGDRPTDPAIGSRRSAR